MIKKVGDTELFSYTGNVQSYIIPKTGIYKLEVWGGKGGDSNFSAIGGFGGYSKGYKKFKKNDVIYVCVGGQGTLQIDAEYAWRSGHDIVAGYNGGGTGRYFYDTGAYYYGNYTAASGGGATHIALVSGTLETIGKESFDINGLIIAGGGGGGHRYIRPSETEYAGTDGNGTTELTSTFGKGENGGNNGSTGYRGYGGGGGGGYYGGVAGLYSIDVGRQGGGHGGSGYITGLDSFEGDNPVMTRHVNNGNGYAQLTLVKSCNVKLGTLDITPKLGSEDITIYLGDKEI